MKSHSVGVVAGLLLLLASCLSVSAETISCPLIDCDCGSIKAGILTRPFKTDCAAEEADIKAKCAAGKTAISCHATAYGPAAYPRGGSGNEPPVDAWVDRIASGLAGTPGVARIATFRDFEAALAALAGYRPSLALFNEIGGVSIDGIDASLRMQDALSELAPGEDGSVTPENARSAGIMMVEGTAMLAGSGPENPSGLYALGKAVERMAAAGIGITDIAGGNAGAARALEQAGKAVAAGASAAELAATGEADAKRFVDDMLNIIPTGASPALSGGAGKFFRDVVDWTKRMWDGSTLGLDVVTRAIETGKVDMAAYEKVSTDLQDLAETGPWGEPTGVDFVKRTAEEIPIVGKLFKALWS